MQVRLQPPTPDAVEQAISLLITSVRSLGDSSEGSPEYDREREIAELELAASAIHGELLLRAALLKRQHNSSQWIYQLPQEIFTDILILDILNSYPAERKVNWPVKRSWQRPVARSTAPRRTQLCNVSHRFLQAIMGTPRIWSNIRWGSDDHIRCLEMSAQAPLSIRCSQYDQIETPLHANMDEFLKAVWEHSWRWEALSLHFGLGARQLLQFLEFTAPQIRDLTMENSSRGSKGLFGGRQTGTNVIKLSGMPALVNLSLDGIGIQWNDLDFSKLRSLLLTRVKEGAPSLKTLTTILNMASSLEQLTLEAVDIIHSTEEQESNLQPIHLAYLRSLWLQELPSGMVDPLLSVIRSPQLKSVYIHGLSAKYFGNWNWDQNPYRHLFQVLIPTLSTSSGLNLSFEIFLSLISLSTDGSALPRPTDNATATEKTAALRVDIEEPVSAVKNMVNFLTSNGIAPPLRIAINERYATLGGPPPTTSSFPVEVLGKLPTVTKISAGALADALNIMAFLGSTRRDEETGRLGWPCPKLEVLNLGGVAGLMPEDYQRLLNARYGNGDPQLIEGEIVWRPRRVQIEHPMFGGVTV
ncbi:hypothetical protein FRC01_011659 [Tulasnella sp. 417]|nr:hypothetical protein FRC01_011659 [Tulasnella sp. 417]